MAAGNVVVYMEAVIATQLGSFNFASNTFIASLVSAGYTPNYASHSLYSTDITQFLTTSGYAEKAITGVALNRLSASQVRFDADDTTFSASATMTAKYCVIRHQTTGRPVCYVDLETGSSTGIDATQIIVQWSSNGIFNHRHSGT